MEPTVTDIDPSTAYDDAMLSRTKLQQHELPRNKVALYHGFGFASHKANNVFYLEADKVLITSAGNTVMFRNLLTNTTKFLFGHDGRGIGSVAVHPNNNFFAVAEKGTNPNIYVYKYPEVILHRILRKGTERAYSRITFDVTGEKLASVGSAPDFLLTVWDWRAERIVLHTKAFGQEVFNVSFSPFFDGVLVTSGTGHIRFWRMASTFTGLKLQGDIGKFGKVELSDIHGYAELPDGKVLSGTERGSLLLWDGNFIKMELVRVGGKPCHDREIRVVHLVDSGGRKRFVTAGFDGYIRWWDFTTIDTAELGYDETTFEVEVSDELFLGAGVKVVSMIQGDNHWIVQDAGGSLIRLDEPDHVVTTISHFHAGKISALEVSPRDHFAATIGEDGSVRCWDYIDKTMLFSRTFTELSPESVGAEADGHTEVDVVETDAMKAGIPTPGTALAWAPLATDAQCRAVAAGFVNGVVRILLRTKVEWKMAHVFKPHNGSVTALAYSPDGGYLVTTGTDKKVWFLKIELDDLAADGVTYRAIAYITIDAVANSISWHENSDRFVLALEDGTVAEAFPPTAEIDTHATYETSREAVRLRVWRFQRIEKEPEAPKEPVEGEEVEISEPEPPKPYGAARTAVYTGSRDGSFYVTMTGFDAGAIHVCDFSSPFPKKSIPSNESDCSHMRVSSSGRFLLTGSDDGTVRVRPTAAILRFNEFRVHDGDFGKITSACASYDDRFVLTVGEDGNFNVFKFKAKEVELLAEKRPTKYEEAEEEPGTALGRLQTVEGCEAIGEVFEAVFSSTFSDPSNEKLERAVEVSDMVAVAAYSIEDEKLKSEEDKALAAAEKKKERVREEINKLRAELVALRADNEKDAKEQQLTAEEFMIDPVLASMFEQQGIRMLEEVTKETAWDTAKADIALAKIRGRYLDELEVEGFSVISFDKKYGVRAYPVARLAEKIAGSLSQIRAIIESETDRKEHDKLAAKETAARVNELLFDMGSVEEVGEAADLSVGAIGASEGVEGEDKELSGWEMRKHNRHLRNAKLAALESQKPVENAEDPGDVMVIDDAKYNMGDYKLKSAKDFVVPKALRVNAMKKRRQMVLLEESVYAIKMSFNRRLGALKELKLQIIDDVKEDNITIEKMNNILEIDASTDAAWLPALHADEMPEGRFTCADDELETFKRKIKAPAMAVPSAHIPSGSEGKAGATGDVGGVKEDAMGLDGEGEGDTAVEDWLATNLAVVKIAGESVSKLLDGEASEPEKEMIAASKMRMEKAKAALLNKRRDTIAAFDDALYNLYSEKVKLNADVKAAEMRLLKLYHELVLLENFETKDKSLQSDLEKCRADMIMVVTEIAECKEKINAKKKEIEVWQEKDRLISNEFNALVGEKNQFQEALLKIFKRKIKRAKKKLGEEEGEVSESDDDAEDFDEEDWNEEDEEEDACPPGCDQALYDKILELREKRLDQEDVLNEFQKAVEALASSHDNYERREKQINKDLKSTEDRIEAFQAEKQRALNDLDVYITLNISQIWCLETPAAEGKESDKGEGKESGGAPPDSTAEMPGGADSSGVESVLALSDEEMRIMEAKRRADYLAVLQLKTDISGCLVFGRQNLKGLERRIGGLGDENNLLKKQLKDLNKTKVKLGRERSVVDAEIVRQQKKCHDLMLLKFKQEIDLDSLDKMSVSDTVRDLNEKVTLQGAEQAREIGLAKQKAGEKQQLLLGLTKTNTKLLQGIAALTEEQYALENELSKSTGTLSVSDDGPAVLKETEERNRLVQLVKLQAKEVDALKAEINMLRHKGGHVYTPSAPVLPAADYHGGVASMVSEAGMTEYPAM